MVKRWCSVCKGSTGVTWHPFTMSWLCDGCLLRQTTARRVGKSGSTDAAAGDFTADRVYPSPTRRLPPPFGDG